MSDQPTRRERYERVRRRRSVVIATVPTIVVVAALVILVPLTPGWERVRQAFFDGDVFIETFPGPLEAFWLDVKILLWSTPFRKIVPPLMNTFVSLQKDVALVSLISPVAILRQAGIDKATYANFTPYVAASLIFLALTIPCTRLADWALARRRARTGATTIA